MALVPAALHGRTRLPLLQTIAWLDDRPPAPPSRRRPLDLPGRCRLLATVAGASTGQRRSPALGASPTGSPADPWPSPASFHSIIGPGGYPRSRTSAPRKIARTSYRTTSAASTPLPSHPPPSKVSQLTA